MLLALERAPPKLEAFWEKQRTIADRDRFAFFSTAVRRDGTFSGR
jgi:hypothetical protein